MMRRCSHCSHNGHNSRTCPNRGVKVFGVRLIDGPIRKCASMGNLSHYTGSNDGPDHDPEDGYASEDFVKGSSSSHRERKKGVAWTEDEHRRFLEGLQKLGKGDWRGIARNFVGSRTPTQVASHAQKYFLRRTNVPRRKRRSSLFDIIPDESADMQFFPMSCQEEETQGINPLPTPPALDEEHESMDSTDPNDGAAAVLNPETTHCRYPVIVPAYFPSFYPYSFPLWPGYIAETAEKEAHEIVKPTATHSKTSINVDGLVGMSKLSLGESIGEIAPSSLSRNLLGGSDRPSAFHANPPTNRSSMNSSTNPIHAV